MKKLMVIGVAALVAAGSYADTVNWNYTGNLAADLSSPAGQAGWLVQMYQDVNNDSVLGSLAFDTAAGDGTWTDANGGSDDVLLGITTFTADSKGSPPITWAALPSVPNNANVYTVIFNQATVGGLHGSAAVLLALFLQLVQSARFRYQRLQYQPAPILQIN